MMSLFWIKIIGIGLLIALFLGMGIAIKSQYNKIKDLDTQVTLKTKENISLHKLIEKQNTSIIESNAKYQEIQKQLDKANEINREVRVEFRKFRDILNRKPVPTTCEEARSEMIEVGKELGEKWKK